jgi:hypothetical protein
MSEVQLPAKVPAGRATRYRCISAGTIAGSHTEGSGKPTRKRCGYCGGAFYTETGLYGVFHWVPQATVNDYSLANALHLFTRAAPAERIADGAYAASSDSDLVVRWIYTV